MPRSAVDRRLVDVESLVADADRRLRADIKRIDRAARATPPADDLPPAVFTAIRAARRDALDAFGKILRLETDEPARKLALTWLSLVASGLTSMYDALRAERVAPATAGKHRRLAQQRLARTGSAFLELDRALGCPHGCKGTG